MTRKRLYIAGQLICGVFVAVMLSWYGYFEPSVIDYSNNPFRVEDTDLDTGEIVKFQIHRINTSNTEVRYQITRSLVNRSTGGREELQSSDVTVPPGQSVKQGALIIPRNMPTGWYAFCGDAIVPHFLRDRRVPWCTEDFHVTSKIPEDN